MVGDMVKLEGAKHMRPHRFLSKNTKQGRLGLESVLEGD